MPVWSVVLEAVVGRGDDHVHRVGREGVGAGQRLRLVADAGEDAVGADRGDARDRVRAVVVRAGVEDREAGGAVCAVCEAAVAAVRVVAGGAGQVGGRVGAARGRGQDLVSNVAEVGGDDVVAVAVAVVGGGVAADHEGHGLLQPGEVAARGHLDRRGRVIGDYAVRGDVVAATEPCRPPCGS